MTKKQTPPRFVAIKSRDNKFYGVVCIENPRTGKAKLLYKADVSDNQSTNADNENAMKTIAGMLNVKMTCEDEGVVAQVNAKLETYQHLLTI